MQFGNLMTSDVDLESMEKLRKKVTHDIEHQIEDLIKLREFVSDKVSIETSAIEVPALTEMR